MTEDTIETVPMPIGPFFRFPDEATGTAALEAAGLLSEEGEYITASHDHALDVIGTISRGGEWDEEGTVITPPEMLDGWHVNYVGELPEGWEQHVVSPENPVRVWA